MADTTISNLTAASALAGTEEIPLSDGTGTTKAATAAQVKTYVNTAPVFAAGSASAGTWPTFTSGTLMTTAEDGAVEMDGDAFYGTTDGGNRGVFDVWHFVRADSSRSLTNGTGEQALFNSPTNGRITLETGLYFFEGMIYITGMSATSGNAAIGILGAGTATCGTWLYHAVGIDNSTPTNAGTQTGSFCISQQTNASALTAATGNAMAAELRGTFEVTSAGTVIPSIALVTASATTLAAGSYIMFKRMGSTSAVSVGQWD